MMSPSNNKGSIYKTVMNGVPPLSTGSVQNVSFSSAKSGSSSIHSNIVHPSESPNSILGSHAEPNFANAWQLIANHEHQHL